MNRLIVFRLAILVMFVVMTGRLWNLQIKQGTALSAEAQGHTTQRVWERPLRGEILASDGKTRLAESLPAYTIAIRPNQLPKKQFARQQVFARLSDMLRLQTSVVLSPTDELRYVQGLRPGLETLNGPLPATIFASPQFTVTVPLGQASAALSLTHQFSQTLQFSSPVERQLLKVGGPSYYTVPITTTRSLDLALAVEENTAWLPGVVVERNYQRFYPRSAEIQSLSHLLGYVGPIDMCEILRRNPASALPVYSDAQIQACGLEPENLLVDSAPLRYLLSDRIGKDGLERHFETDLRGKLGEEQVEIDVHSRLVSPPEVKKVTEDGSNLVLTINYELQKQTEAIIRRWIGEAERRRQHPDDKHSAQLQYTPIEAGTAIVLEVNTGRVLAMVSWPAFDNNVFARGLDPQDVKLLFDPPNRHPAPALNQNIAALLPPGSTWKQFAASAALQGGAIGPNTAIRDTGALYVKNQYYETNPKYDQYFPNSILKDRGYIDVRTALEWSSNNFFQAAMGGTEFVRNRAETDKIKGLDPSGERMAAMAHAYGFGESTGVDLPNEFVGTVPSKAWKKNLPEGNGNRNDPWSIGDMYNAAIGQGFVLVTPLQLVTASAAVANNGTLYKPQLVKQIVDPQGNVTRTFDPEVRRQVAIDPAYLQAIREGMHLSVTDGFNKCARKDISGLEIAGKTGTAEYTELIDPNKPEDVRYREDNFRKRSHSWFVGFAPYDKPQIEVLAFVGGSGDMSDGSATITVPAVTEIMQAYFGVVPPQQPPPTVLNAPPLPCHVN